MSRRTLSDAQCATIGPLVPGKKGDRGRTGADKRLFIDAILWLACGATPWRDLPPELGNWRTVHSRFRRWTLAGVWESLFNPVENLWQYLRQNHLANRVFDSFDDIVEVCCTAWNARIAMPQRLASITLREWAQGSG